MTGAGAAEGGNMTLQQLKYAITVADCGSMNEAARQLFVSQPSLSASVRELEKEIGFTVFLRTNRGIVITPEGEEFLGYARQVAQQYRLLANRYIEKEAKEKFSVSMQHYSFAVKAFVDTVQRMGMDEYEFAVHETKTFEVIENVRDMKSELGILYVSDFNRNVLEKIFRDNQLVFTELFSCDTYVYLWSKHPLAEEKILSMEQLEPYPCLAFDQGKNNSFYLAEEMKSTYDYKRIIKGNDRATMLNLMIALNGYTLCSGIICDDLNGDDARAIPLRESEKITIGYISRKGSSISPIGKVYLQELKKYAGRVGEPPGESVIK